MANKGASKDRSIMLRRLQVYEFALLEAHLFLDTHPTDKDALAYFNKYLALHDKTMKEYVKEYGPIRVDQYDGGPAWKWVEGPWPWENGKEMEG